MEQINIFDFIEEDRFCFDDDTNHIVELIEQIMKPYMDDGTFTEQKNKFEIWEHVENLWYRLSMIYTYNDDITKEYFQYKKGNPLYIKKINELNFDEVFKYCNDHNIELSIHSGPFIVCIFTRFLDKRKNIKGDY